MIDRKGTTLRESLANLLTSGVQEPVTLVLWAAQVAKDSGQQLALRATEQLHWLQNLPEAARLCAVELRDSLDVYLGALGAHGGSIELVIDPDLRAELREDCDQMLTLRNGLHAVIEASGLPRLDPGTAAEWATTGQLLQHIDEAAADMPSAWVHLRNDLQLPLLATSPWKPMVQEAARQFEILEQHVELSDQDWKQAGMAHPTTGNLTDYIFGDLARLPHALVEAHLRLCAECRELVEQLSPMGELRGAVIQKVLDDALAGPATTLDRIRGWFSIPGLADVLCALAPSAAMAAAAEDDMVLAPRFFASCDAHGVISLGGLVFGMAIDQNRTFLFVESQTDQTELLDVRCCLADTSAQAGHPDFLRPTQRGPQWQLHLAAQDLAKVRSGDAELVVVGTYRINQGDPQSVAVVYTNLGSEGAK